MPLRWEFRLFRLDSRPISACFGWRPIQPDMARFWPNQLGSARIPKKKKKTNKQTQMQHRRVGNRVGCCVLRWTLLPASDSGAALSQLHPCFLAFNHNFGAHQLVGLVFTNALYYIFHISIHT